MSRRIEDYAILGDGETAALLSRYGSIDWLCWPRFDSDACCAALLGDSGNGCWSIAPGGGETASIARRYQTDSLIMETDFTVADGSVRLIDFMPPRQGRPALVRILHGLSGRVRLRMSLRLRFDYGYVPPWIELTEGGAVARIGPDLVALRSPFALEREGEDIFAEFTIGEGERKAFVLRYGASTAPPPPPIDAEEALVRTQTCWREWIAAFDKPTRWPDATRRSLITLKALIHAPTGGLVAAPTTSLPEEPGGKANWDYRYCWVRDASFATTALLNAGYHEEARAWLEWIVRAIAGAPEKLRIMYRVDGARRVDEWNADWLPGFNWARPVRIGNAAAAQHQVDVSGELLDAMHLADKAGVRRSTQNLELERRIVDHLEANWRGSGQGLWEARGESRRHTYSNAMACVGVDSFVRGARKRGDVDESRLAELEALRDRIHSDVCANGYDPGLGRFVEYYGGQELDASLLLLPIVGFLPADDPRISATVSAIERELTEDGLVWRNKRGLRREGAFLACSFWLADCLLMQGRREAAELVFERALSVRNDLGLLSEQYDAAAGRLVGNFPQALSHLGLVTTALNLSGPTLARGGG